MSFYASKALEPSAQIARRIKKVKMIVSSLATESDNRVYHEYQRSYNRRVAAICEATIDNFRGARILRDACHVIFVEFIPDMIKPLTNHILPKLKNFKGFRTVLVEVSLDDMYEARVRWEKSQNMGAEGEITAQVEQIRKAIKNAMEPTLGPATTVKDGHEISLKFHPRQHVPRLLRAKAQQILLDADRMEEGD